MNCRMIGAANIRKRKSLVEVGGREKKAMYEEEEKLAPEIQERSRTSGGQQISSQDPHLTHERKNDRTNRNRGPRERRKQILPRVRYRKNIEAGSRGVGARERGEGGNRLSTPLT